MNTNRKIILYSACSIYLLFSACQSPEQKNEFLARQYCAGCHSFPDPQLLDKKTWETGVLPEMAFRMGLDITRIPRVGPVELSEILKTLPGNPLVSEKEWKAIQQYYLSNAPDSLVRPRKTNVSTLHQFTPFILRLPISSTSLLTLVKYDDIHKEIFVGTRKGKLFQLKSSLGLADSFQLESPPSDILFSKLQTPVVSCMGIMDPNDQEAGSIVRLTSHDKDPGTLIDSLKRPVDIQQADLNNDGDQDLLVAAFGNFSGALLAYENRDGKYLPHIIHNFPGTRKTIVKDFNQDGRMDVVALISQGDEQIALFTNRGHFKFSYQVLLRFPPVYGSSFFELDDFNGDGNFDILYTNGDNADYSPVLKPYHGVKIFLNDGKNHFTEHWSYSMYGASMAHATDFDADGDLDIAAISFFPDFKKNPEQSFIYFENDHGNFTPYATKVAASARWIVMEAADIDDDHDVDLILGALNFPRGVPDSLFTTWTEHPASLLILKNNYQ